MSSDVVLTSALRSNLLSLQNTQRLIDDTQLRLATGLKVNSALDNPQNFFAAQSLNNRASDLGRLLDGISQSIRTIEEADNGITGLTALIEQAESVALEAQSEARAAEGFARVQGTVDLEALGTTIADGTVIDGDGAGGDDTNQFSISIVQKDANGDVVVDSLAADITIGPGTNIDSIVAAINSDGTIGAGAAEQLVRASVGSGGQLRIESLVDGAQIRINEGTTNSVTAAGFAKLGLDNIVSTENNVAATRQSGTSVAGRTITSQAALPAAQAANGTYEASATLAQAGFAQNFAGGGDELTVGITIDGITVNATTVFDDTSTVQDVIDAINNEIASDGNVTASFNTDSGQIELEFGDDVGQAAINFGTTGGGDIAFGFGAGTGYGDFADTDFATLTAATETISEQFTFVGSSADLAQFQSDFNEIRSQIDTLVEDANYRGVNLLGGDDLVTFFNEDRDNTLETQGVDFTALGLGVGEADFTTVADIQVSIDTAREALLSVRSFGQSIANDLSIIQTRRDFTESTINTLESGADDLVVADQNEEGANLLALQTRQTLGVTSLSLASQSQQAVLRLF